MKHPVDVYVGSRIRRRRRLVGITQQQLGDKVGIKFQQIQKYETGLNRVSASRLWDIAQALDVPVAHFFEGVDAATRGDAVQAAKPDAFASDEEALALVRAYQAMPEVQRKHLFDLAQVLSQGSAA